MEYELSGDLGFVNCSSPIKLAGLHVSLGSTSDGLLVDGCHYVSFLGLVINGSNDYTNLLVISNGSTVYMQECAFYRSESLISAWPGTTLVCHNIMGAPTLSTGRFLSAAGASIMWYGTRPSGVFDNANTTPCLIACSASTNNLEDLSIDTGSAPQPPARTYQVSIPANNSGNAYSKNNWATCTWQSTAQANYVRQGADNNAQYAGCMWFSKPNDMPASVTVKSAILTLRRNSEAGKSGPVAVTVYSNTVTKDSGNPYVGVQNATYLGNIEKGAISDVSAPGLVTIAQALMDGTANAIVFYCGDSPTGTVGRYSTNWARFDGIDETVPSLTITYTTGG